MIPFRSNQPSTTLLRSSKYFLPISTCLPQYLQLSLLLVVIAEFYHMKSKEKDSLFISGKCKEKETVFYSVEEHLSLLHISLCIKGLIRLILATWIGLLFTMEFVRCTIYNWDQLTGLVLHYIVIKLRSLFPLGKVGVALKVSQSVHVFLRSRWHRVDSQC